MDIKVGKEYYDVNDDLVKVIHIHQNSIMYEDEYGNCAVEEIWCAEDEWTECPYVDKKIKLYKWININNFESQWADKDGNICARDLRADRVSLCTDVWKKTDLRPITLDVFNWEIVCE